MKRQWDLSGWRWMNRKRESLTEWGEGGVQQREQTPSVIEIYSVQSTQRNTSLFWDVRLRWTTRTLALWDALRVRLSACEKGCATEDGINKNWILIWNLQRTKSKGLIPASLEAAPLSVLGFLSCILKHRHTPGHQVISNISRVVSYSWFKIKKSLKGMKVSPGEARAA